MKKKALVIVAHPDDEVIGVGGTILKLQEEYGYEVTVSFLTTSHTELNRKWKCVDKASKILGTGWDKPDYRRIGEEFTPLCLDTEPISKLIDYVENILDSLEPEIVFTHHVGDLNQDHRAIAEAVLIATRPFPGQVVKRLYTFDTASSTEWGFGELPKFEPNTFIDISRYMDKKKEALRVYKKEILDLESNHPRSLENIEIASKLKGSVIGLKNVETFKLVRSIDVL